jgi:hypothetical protein
MSAPNAPTNRSPRTALMQWLAQLHYNQIRRIETLFSAVAPDKRPLRGVLIAEDLCLTRKRAFYRIIGERAVLLSIEDVAANYSLGVMQSTYRAAMESWKSQRRRSA